MTAEAGVGSTRGCQRSYPDLDPQKTRPVHAGAGFSWVRVRVRRGCDPRRVTRRVPGQNHLALITRTSIDVALSHARGHWAGTRGRDGRDETRRMDGRGTRRADEKGDQTRHETSGRGNEASRRRRVDDGETRRGARQTRERRDEWRDGRKCRRVGERRTSLTSVYAHQRRQRRCRRCSLSLSLSSCQSVVVVIVSVRHCRRRRRRRRAVFRVEYNWVSEILNRVNKNVPEDRVVEAPPARPYSVSLGVVTRLRRVSSLVVVRVESSLICHTVTRCHAVHSRVVWTRSPRIIAVNTCN